MKQQVTLLPGQSVTVGNAKVTFDHGGRHSEGGHPMAFVAELTIEVDGEQEEQ